MKTKIINKNIFGSTRWKLDFIAASFILFILIIFSYAIYYLLTLDIIYQTKGEFVSNINEHSLFENFKEQTIFLLIFADTIIFIISMILFDKFVQKMLGPIEYLSNIQKKFAENISHELRTPLSIVNIQTDLLLNKIENKKYDENILINSIENIQKEIKGITPLIDNLLFEARIQYEEIKIEKINLLKLIKIIENISENLKQNKSENVFLKIENNFNEKDFDKYFEMNIIHIERIFNNLISNSFKFTKEGEINIFLNLYQNRKKEFLKIIIEDTGIGIKKEDIEKIGERFFRGKNVEKEIPGTGIGIAIIKDLSKVYNFEIDIKSQENVGTKIILSKIEIKS